jgi:hypothetical protein
LNPSEKIDKPSRYNDTSLEIEEIGLQMISVAQRIRHSYDVGWIRFKLLDKAAYPEQRSADAVVRQEQPGMSRVVLVCTHPRLPRVKVIATVLT